MPLSHDPPEFLLHKAGPKRTEIGRARRTEERSHLKNGQNIYSGNNGEWTDGKTDGQRTTANAAAPPLRTLEIAVENRRKKIMILLLQNRMRSSSS